jgi:SAM-dependent methyltransferase
MLLNESKWIGTTLIKINRTSGISPLLNVGSSTGHFRKVVQPQINNNIFEPLEKEGVQVVHLDLKDAEGVDLVGNVMEQSFFETVKQKKFRGILCSNLLEHIENPRALTHELVKLVETGEYILVTVPHVFPYHNDPIDTYFRPTVNELASYFPNTKVIASEIVVEEGTFFKMLLQKPKLFAITFIRLFLPFYKFQSWKMIWNDYFRIFQRFSSTCILLQKE